MTCDTALERILEADPEELSGARASPLAEHLERCERCRALAGAVLDGQAALGAVLAAQGPRSGVEEALAEARASVRGGAEREERGRGRRRWAWGALPVAAAALLAALLLVDGDAPGSAVVTPAESAPGMVRRTPVSVAASRRSGGAPDALPRPPRVAAPGSGNVAVIQTSNPRISVVWIQGASD